jgi:tRNA/rRNA methyltransferase
LSPENIGLAARAMKNTGFSGLRVVQDGPLPRTAWITAVHAEDILDRARIYPDLAAAVSDLDVVFAAVARHRKNFPSQPLEMVLERMGDYPPPTRIGLVFGNERSGLSSGELRHSNFRFTIPQAAPQPSYNLASAVLITLFQVVSKRSAAPAVPSDRDRPLPRRDQEECIRLILGKLEEVRFIHPGNREHVAALVNDLFGRLAMTARDRDLLLAIFGKGIRDP